LLSIKYLFHGQISEIQFLEPNTCLGLKIIVDNEINYEVFIILQKKYNNGEKFDKLERIIADVAVYQMGKYKIDGKVNSASDFNENSFEKLNKI